MEIAKNNCVCKANVDYTPILSEINNFSKKIKEKPIVGNFSNIFEYFSNLYQNINLTDNKKKNGIDRKLYGIFYTPYELAKIIVKRTLAGNENLEEKVFLEPCAGLGSFTINYIDFVLKHSRKKITKDFIQKLLKNIYTVEIDEKAVEIYKELLKLYFKMEWNLEISNKDIQNNISSKGLIFSKDFNYIDLKNLFGTNFNGADIVITNPPYYNLRFVSREWITKKEAIAAKEHIRRILELIETKDYKHQGSGTKNLYKVFMEEIIQYYTKKTAKIGLLIPYSFLTTSSNMELRALLFKNKSVTSIQKVEENIKDFYPVGQTMVILNIDKEGGHNRIDIFEPICTANSINNNKLKVSIYCDKLNEKSVNGFKIADINEIGYEILEKMQAHPKIKDIKFILNRRGEVDVSLQKQYIKHSTSKTDDITLVRGRNIKPFILNLSKIDFLHTKSKVYLTNRKIINSNRLVCTQISNINAKDRLKFALLSGAASANSCNYLYCDDKEFLFYLLGILNSLALEWRFRVFSSNNHISNYEIGELPIPVDKNENYFAIIDTVKKILLAKENYSLLQQKLDKLVFNLYGINTDEKLYILKYLGRWENLIYNHWSYKLSDFDMEIVKSVKEQGANWKAIPSNLIERSERLKKIKHTGGRTTLYGRLKWDKPSYTINTYFYRPGNGAHIHPDQNRVLTAREAARLQSFPDNYIFWGSKISVAKQIGNAIPPLLSYALINHLKKTLEIKKAIDLFSGAGGSEIGLKMAGVKTIVANDIDRYACMSYEYNNPDVAVICGNIFYEQTRRLILDAVKGHKIDLVMGGPPCQGFSLAGRREVKDPRNYLFIPFINLIKELSPKIIIMENVPGILSMDKGEVFNKIKNLFAESEYNIYVKTLLTSWYGVPQLRRRVFLIGIKSLIIKSINTQVDNLFPEPIFFDNTAKDSRLFVRYPDFITVKEAISDLPFPAKDRDEILRGYKINNKKELSSYQMLMRGLINIVEFYQIEKVNR